MTCNNCGLASQFQCGMCLETTYCSQKCASQDWKSFHSFQCIGVKRGRPGSPEPQPCHNEQCPISLEKISELEPDNVFALSVGNQKYCFSLDALVAWVQHNPTNPLTRQVLSVEEMGEITAANNHLLDNRRIAAEIIDRQRQEEQVKIFQEYTKTRFGENGDSLRIFIKWIDGRTLMIRTNPKERTEKIVSHLASRMLGPEVSLLNIRLTYDGQEIMHGFRIEKYIKKNDETVHAELKWSGWQPFLQPPDCLSDSEEY